MSPLISRFLSNFEGCSTREEQTASSVTKSQHTLNSWQSGLFAKASIERMHISQPGGSSAILRSSKNAKERREHSYGLRQSSRMRVTACACSQRLAESPQSQSRRLRWVLAPTPRSSRLPRLLCSMPFQSPVRENCDFLPTLRMTDRWCATIGAISIPTVRAALSLLPFLIRYIRGCVTGIIASAIYSHLSNLSQFEHLPATIDGHAEVVMAELVSGNFFQGMSVNHRCND